MLNDIQCVPSVRNCSINPLVLRIDTNARKFVQEYNIQISKLYEKCIFLICFIIFLDPTDFAHPLDIILVLDVLAIFTFKSSSFQYLLYSSQKQNLKLYFIQLNYEENWMFSNKINKILFTCIVYTIDIRFPSMMLLLLTLETEI